jgi:hypothetical protein
VKREGEKVGAWNPMFRIEFSHKIYSLLIPRGGEGERREMRKFGTGCSSTPVIKLYVPEPKTPHSRFPVQRFHVSRRPHIVTLIVMKFL